MSTLTRAAIEVTLISRCDAAMAIVGMNVATRDGTNPDLTDPIRCAVREIGYDTIDPMGVGDNDLAPLTGNEIDRVLDRAEQRLLETIWNKWTRVDEAMGDDNQKLSQLADRIMKRIADLEERIRRPYGYERTGGVLRPSSVVTTRRNDQSRWSPRGWPYP